MAENAKNPSALVCNRCCSLILKAGLATKTKEEVCNCFKQNFFYKQ